MFYPCVLCSWDASIPKIGVKGDNIEIGQLILSSLLMLGFCQQRA